MKTSNWLTDPRQKELYEGTQGPSNSPDPFECWILRQLAMDSNGRVLEIGSWRGRSACFIADGLQKIGGQPPICVDWFQGDNTGGMQPDKAEMESVLKKFGLQANIIDHDMLTMDWSIAKDVSLVFYDADHSTKPTVDVLTKLHPFLAKDARIVLHDAGWSMTIAAAEELIHSGLYRPAVFIKVWQGLSILQKN
ncbi:MAG TPA: class I SAM-dependent methyltransferase [Chthoniobacter sp.]|nr:class I SAM-dependent methyltransferase [Chthoniobacter sp.]